MNVALSHDMFSDHPDQCFDSVNQLYYDLQTSWVRPGLCEQLLCTPYTEPGQLTITHHGCGVVIVEPPCELRPGNLSLLYPDCCFSVYCPPEAPTPKRY
uniref:Single domain-containing protein n=1 Tax=Timema monikensis TaxID=170555 RepID=A0A7R9EEU0_9NEOP|nr:unnamed protein product [Timema monikensis]